MRALPLYPTLPGSPIETGPRLARDPACARCALSKGATTICVPSMGLPGGVLFVGEGPGQREDLAGKPFQGASGRYLFDTVRTIGYAGPVAVANAMGCAPIANKTRGPVEIKASHVEACRPFLAEAIERYRPARIIALGRWAALSLVGRSVAPFKTRRGVAFLYRAPIAWALEALAEENGTSGDEPQAEALLALAKRARATGAADTYFLEQLSGDAAVAPIPVFFVMHPAAALRNSMLKTAFEADLRRALTASPPAPAPLRASYFMVETPLDAAAACGVLRSVPYSAVDIEAGGAVYDRSYRVVSLAACARGSDNAYVWDERALRGPAAAPLHRYLADRRAAKIGAHFQYDVGGIEHGMGVRVEGIAGDVRLWRKLIEPHASGALEDLVELVGMGGMKDEGYEAMLESARIAREGCAAEKMLAQRAADASARTRDGQPPKKWPKLSPKKEEGLAYMRKLTERDPVLAAVVREQPGKEDEGRWMYALIAHDAPELLARYNARDAVGTARLGPYLEGRFEEEPAAIKRMKDMLVDRAQAAISRVQHWGIAASRSAILAFDAFLLAQLGPVDARLAQYPVENWNSPQQVAKLLFENLKLPPQKKTATGYSTDDSVLEALKGAHPVIEDLSKHRQIVKMRSNYAAGEDGKSGLLTYIRDDGRIHGTIFLDGAETGRASIIDPALQTLPSKKFPVEGKLCRDIFVAAPGKVLLSIDYSQIELRWAAMLSEDAVMRAIFEEGIDFHLRTAQLIAPIVWGIRAEDVTDEHRAHAKNFNFGLLYGMGDKALAARMFGVQEPNRKQIAMAEKIRAAIMGKFAGLARWIAMQYREGRRTGEMWTTFHGQPGRRRTQWDLFDEDDLRRSRAENGLINGPCQGGAADDLLESLTRTVEWILEEGIETNAKVVLPIHDQLLLESSCDYVNEVLSTTIEIMEDRPGAVKRAVDAEIGPSWGSLRKLKRGPDGWKCHVEDRVVDGLKKAIWTPVLRGPIEAYDAARVLAA